jgi:RimJ/RimL family protein N-acetyltransferase
MTLDMTVNQPVLNADRFQLRPLQMSDTGLIELYAGDLRVAQSTTSIPHPFPPGAAEALVTRAQAPDRTEDIWVIDGSTHGGDALLGMVSLNRMDRHQSEIGYWVAPAFWNGGIASEAVGAVITANPQNSDTIFAEVFQDNPASARVLTNLGFAYLGDAEAFSVARNAKVNTWTYSLKVKRR